ncbi:MAG: hypothetical protein DWQ42_04120 [Planctomycetota bacterium]|nr:MAG: hypothetical protein DWQ42_04120 [Planctomycetota bacterium]REK46615.1 MAG: hypothetical protein DWQ46_07015 [Planctomycetota bacterium]
MSASTSLLFDAPVGRRRTFVNGFLVVFILVQLLLPLRYYSGAAQDDPRFSWRMFADPPLYSIEVHTTVEQEGRLTEKAVDLQASLPSRWQRTLRRRHLPLAAEKLMRWCCQKDNAVRVRLLSDRVLDQGQRVPKLRLSMDCESLEAVAIGPMQ